MRALFCSDVPTPRPYAKPFPGLIDKCSASNGNALSPLAVAHMRGASQGFLNPTSVMSPQIIAGIDSEKFHQSLEIGQSISLARLLNLLIATLLVLGIRPPPFLETPFRHQKGPSKTRNPP